VTKRLLLSGGRGLICSAVSRFLASQPVKTDLQYLSRTADVDGTPAVRWDPEMGHIDADGLEGFDAVIHLAGESISGRWTKARKRRIRDSRVGGTALLSNALARCARPPKTLICASAIGYYGDRGDQIVDEDSAAGAGFLADVVRDWEDASAPALAAGIRVVHLRFGLVLSSSGGALASMLLPFRLGLGGPVGSGRQYLSWVTLRDVVGVIDHVLAHDTMDGAINVTTPDAVTQRVFARTLGHTVRRPSVLPLPGWAVRLLLGEMGQELLLASTRVHPRQLLASGYTFEQQDLGAALADLLTASRKSI
jgi:uncharacterized protein (TIGR01777 family)